MITYILTPPLFGPTVKFCIFFFWMASLWPIQYSCGHFWPKNHTFSALNVALQLFQIIQANVNTYKQAGAELSQAQCLA